MRVDSITIMNENQSYPLALGLYTPILDTSERTVDTRPGTFQAVGKTKKSR